MLSTFIVSLCIGIALSASPTSRPTFRPTQTGSPTTSFTQLDSTGTFTSVDCDVAKLLSNNTLTVLTTAAKAKLADIFQSSLLYPDSPLTSANVNYPQSYALITSAMFESDTPCTTVTITLDITFNAYFNTVSKYKTAVASSGYKMAVINDFNEIYNTTAVFDGGDIDNSSNMASIVTGLLFVICIILLQ